MKCSDTIFLLFCIVVKTCAWPNSCTFQHTLSRNASLLTTVSYFSRYTTKCGIFNWGTCSRYRWSYRNEQRYYTEYYYDYYHEDCEGYCHSYQCNECAAITNCEQIRCTTASDQCCHQCIYIASGGYSDRICEQRCSWRPDSKFCYPGRCTTTPSTCQCAPNFSGDNCLQMTTSPVMHFCSATLIQVTGDRAYALCDNHGNAQTTIYTNIQPDRIQVELHNSYTGPDAADWPQQYYVNDFKVGVISASFDWWVTRGGSIVKTGTDTCSNGYSQDNPHQGMYECDVIDNIGFTFQHEDRLHLTAKAHNGGYITIRNYDAASGYLIGPKIYYTGMEVAHTADFILDYQSPEHCTLTRSCSDNMLDRGPAITKIRRITVRFNGWHDDISGILRYKYEVYKMQAYDDVLGYRSTPPAISGQVNPPTTQFTITLRDPGVYCVLLNIDDVAGNQNTARRFLMFDDVTIVTVDTTHQYPMWVESAAEITNYLWQTNLQDSYHLYPQIVLRWTGHFYNYIHRQHKLLNAIEDNSPPLTSQYEEATGQPPATRSREAIPNINAIVRFEVAYSIDHQGGRTITSPPRNWRDVNNIMVEQQGLSVPRNDGDSIHLWVRATDVMGNTNQDDVLIHVDSSPPEIHDMSLIVDWRTWVVFKTYDDHSGLHQIQWNVADVDGVNLSPSGGNVAVRRPSIGVSLCELPNCACIPKDGECYYRDYAVELDANLLGIPTEDQEKNNVYYYLFTITTTNNAMLTSTRSFQITFNTSSLSTHPVISTTLASTDSLMTTTVDVNTSYTRKPYRHAKVDILSPSTTMSSSVDVNSTIKTYRRAKVDILLPCVTVVAAVVVVTAITIVGIIVLCRRKKKNKPENTSIPNHTNNSMRDDSILGVEGHVYDNITEYEQRYMSIIKKDITANHYESVVGSKQHYADINKDDIKKNVYETPTNVRNNEIELIRY